MLSERSDRKNQKAFYNANGILDDFEIINFISSLETRTLHAELTAVTICRTAT